MNIYKYRAQNHVIANPMNTIHINNLLDAFINSQDVKLSSKNLYRRTLKQYFKWVYIANYSLDKISRNDIILYKQYLSIRLSSLTVASYITSVRKFYEWAESNKYYLNVAKGIKSPKRKQQFKKQPLSILQSTTLLNLYLNKDLRNYAIVNLLLRTGIRTIELVRANVKDISLLGGKRVLLVQGKSKDDKDDFVLLTDKAYKPILNYLYTRTNIVTSEPFISEPLFTSRSNNSKGKKLTTRSISYIVKQGLKSIGLHDNCYTAHSLRHTTAVSILRAGGSLEKVQFTLRHINPATTQIYTATLNEERRLSDSGEALIDNLY